MTKDEMLRELFKKMDSLEELVTGVCVCLLIFFDDVSQWKWAFANVKTKC